MDRTSREGARLAAPRPDGVRVEDENGVRLIVFGWFRLLYVFMVAFCVFWDGFLVFWYRTALSGPSPSPLALWFPVLHVAAGIGLTYSTIAGFVNRTEIRVGSADLSIWHGPLPWWGSKTVPRTDIAQLYREQTFAGRNRSASWHLSAVTPDGRQLRLLRSVPSPELALYLESELESALGIADVAVTGEMPK